VSGIRFHNRSAPASSRQIREFVAHIDRLAERLTPPRRPQDAREPECSRTELRILAALSRKQPVAMSDLAASLDIPLSTATRAVGKLVAKGLVERRGLRQDRRVVQVGFSRRGREINRYVARSRQAVARAMLQPLSPTARANLIERLARLGS